MHGRRQKDNWKVWALNILSRHFCNVFWIGFWPQGMDDKKYHILKYMVRNCGKFPMCDLIFHSGWFVITKKGRACMLTPISRRIRKLVRRLPFVHCICLTNKYFSISEPTKSVHWRIYSIFSINVDRLIKRLWNCKCSVGILGRCHKFSCRHSWKIHQFRGPFSDA